MISSLVATVSSLLSHTLRNCKQKKREKKKEEGRRGVSVTGSAKVAPLERYSWHGLHLPIVGGIFISFAFAYPATTCAASIIMINKFSLPIFDFNLQSPLSLSPLHSRLSSCSSWSFWPPASMLWEDFEAHQKTFLLYFFLLSLLFLLLFLLQWLFVLRRH